MVKPYGVSAAHPLAVDVGMSILKKGGNAVDAAAAISFALGVVEPYASGIGGGGNMLIYPQDHKAPVIYDYRETAPHQIHKLYNVGVPGLVKGMEKVVSDFGQLTLKEVLQPAIQLADNGFAISEIISNNLKTTKHVELFELDHFYPNGQPLEQDERLVQYELAETMNKIAEHGSKYFYEGAIAEAIVDAQVGITYEDMEAYDIKVRRPLHATYGSFDVWSAPAPVGGSLIIQTLQLAEKLGIDKYDTSSPDFIIGLSKILHACYELRFMYNGDPDFVTINEQTLFEDSYIEALAESIKQNTNIPDFIMKDVNHTTHFSVIDAHGMVVSTTNTLSNFFGSGVYIDGIFLNNQMQNFTDDCQSPNVYEHGKRCQSLIAPTVISKNGHPYMAIGASGAARIPTIISKVIMAHMKQGVSLTDAISEGRFFVSTHEVFCEQEMSNESITHLKEHGYDYIYHPDPMFYGGVQAIVTKDGSIEGAADPRRGGTFKSNVEQSLHK